MNRVVSLAAVAAVFLLSACGGQDGAGPVESAPAVSLVDGMSVSVVGVESGNTFTADLGGVEREVRLINVSAPSVNGVANSSTCLVDESAARLSELLPAGSEVTLSFDESQRGSTGYVEAAVYSGEVFVNREMARSGLVATTFTTAADEFYGEVSQGQQEAAREGVGLYSRDVECSIPAQIEAQRAAVEDARSWQVDTSEEASAEEKAREGERQAVYRAASELYRDFDGQKSAPAQWVGSIVTLDAVREQLDDLHRVLGDDFYPERGTSVNQQKKAEQEATPVRPGS